MGPEALKPCLPVPDPKVWQELVEDVGSRSPSLALEQWPHKLQMNQVLLDATGEHHKEGSVVQLFLNCNTLVIAPSIMIYCDAHYRHSCYFGCYTRSY